MKHDKTQIKSQYYKKVFDTFYDALCLFSNKFVNNLHTSKDVVQDVFIKIWNDSITFENDDHAKAFLYTAVRNKSLDYLKSKEFQSKQSLDVNVMKTLASETYFEKQVLIEETVRTVNEAINTLPFKCKRIIHLSLKGLENKQISEELSISLNTVKTQKRIAYQKLRPLLKGACAVTLYLSSILLE